MDHVSTYVRRSQEENAENEPQFAEQEEDPYDYYDEIGETVDRTDLLYGEEDEEDNYSYETDGDLTEDYSYEDYEYNYEDEDSSSETEEPSTTENPDNGAVIIGSVDTSEDDDDEQTGVQGPPTTRRPGGP